MAYSRLLSGSERVSSRDQRMRRVKDQDGRVRDQGIKRTQGLGDQRTKGPKDQGTRGPRDQGTRGPGDQRIRGPPEIMFPVILYFFQGPRSFFTGNLDFFPVSSPHC